MTDREALLRSILDNPDDDTLRLIYADAIEEESDSRRAAFIRAQIEYARLPEYDPVRIRARYHDREKMFGARWMMELPALPEGLRWATHPFRRGFPSGIQSRDAATFVEHADGLFRQFPIDTLELSIARLSETREFTDCPWISHLVRLSLPEGLSGQAAGRLIGSPHYQRLRELHIGAGLTTNSTASSLVRSRLFKQLTSLGFRNDRQGGGTLVNELSQLADPPRLRTLDLSGNRLGAEHLQRLLASPMVSTVDDLDLSDNHLGTAGIEVMAAASLPFLRSLHLVRARPETEGIRALREARFLPELRSLALGGNVLPPQAGEVLAGAAGVANLLVLDLRDNRLGDAGAAALASSPFLRNLVLLDLSTNEIEDEGAEAIAESPHLNGLIYLDLHANMISTNSAARLKRRFGDRVFL